jgi:UDP-glucose 4-epimerase
MHVLITGGGGLVGRFIAARISNDGHYLTSLGRQPLDWLDAEFVHWDLSEKSFELPAADVLVHCAFSHVPGKYRGGEGDDPTGFVMRNAEGTVRLLEAAKTAGIAHCVFLSSRAVYSDTGNWVVLPETAETEPDTLYGKVKLFCEQALESLCDDRFKGTVLRATGVYGVAPGKSDHKWSTLFARFERGEIIQPRLGTEVHGEDLADGVALVLDKRQATTAAPFEVYNVSDLLLDRRDLIKLYAEERGLSGINVPARAEGPLGVMEPGKLKALGWSPGGNERLHKFLEMLT